jgi:peptidoglycan/LPS O-acetylase OafA/YrhL
MRILNRSAIVNRLDYIDSLRALAILMVVFIHTSQPVSGLSLGTQNALQFSQMGVQLFFVLSALTLCMSVQRTGMDRKELQRFYIRRYFRIAPLYYIGIFFYLLLNTVKNYSVTGQFLASENYTLGNIFSNIFLVHGFVPSANNNIVPGGWSIGTEMAFYLIFPFIFLLFEKSAKWLRLAYPVIVLAINIVVIDLTGNSLNMPLGNNSFLYYNLFNMLPIFLLGMSYFFYLRDNNRKFLIYNKPILMATTLTVLFFAMLSFYNGFHLTITPFLFGLAFVLFIDIFKHFAALNIPFLVKIGRLSFSMYIFHFVFAWTISRQINNLLVDVLPAGIIFAICLLLTVLGTMVVANISEKLIEKPGIQFGKYIIRTRLPLADSFKITQPSRRNSA